jgi:phosphonate transport system substrate-binding protein
MFATFRSFHPFKRHNGPYRQLCRQASFLTLLALASCGTSDQPPDPKAGWRGQVKELRFSLLTTNQITGQPIRIEAFQHYMEQATGVPVRVRQASDIYTASIQALSSGQVDVALLAGGGYVNAREQVGGLVSPLLVMLGAHGEHGYYSSLIVRADSPYRSVADLKGKSLAVVDLNSTSGYLMPMHAMREHGINPDSYFSNVGVAGGHPQAVTAVYNRQYDAAWSMSAHGTPQSGFIMTSWSRMEDRGVIPHGAIRDIWDVGPVPNSAFVMRTDRPQAAQDLVRGAMAAIPYDQPDILTDIGTLPGTTLAAGSDAMFAEMFKLRKDAVAGQRAAAGGAAPRGAN